MQNISVVKKIGGMLIGILCTGMLPAQGHGNPSHGGWHHNDYWPDSLEIMTVSGVAQVDTSLVHPRFFIDSDEDGNSDYQLGFGPYWYEPESGAVRPAEGDSLVIVGGLVDDMTPPVLVVFIINGITWRDSTGAPPWSGGWVHQDANDTTWVFCPTDSMDQIGFPPGCMGGMMWPDSIYCLFEEVDTDSLPVAMDSTMFEGYFCGFNAPGGNGMGNGMMGFNQSLDLRIHYRDENLSGVNESTIQVYFLNGNNTWELVDDFTLNTAENTIIIHDNNISNFYALKGEATVGTNGENNPEIPLGISIDRIYPNPFNPETVISYTINQSEHYRVTIYDLLGREIRTLHNGILTSGRHDVRWDARDNHGKTVSSGSYRVVISNGKSSVGSPVTLLR